MRQSLRSQIWISDKASVLIWRKCLFEISSYNT
nr:MAG TPA: hypothetical protein [Caudoviricetes sp.]